MRHLLIDGRFNTFDNWGLVLSEKKLEPPEPKYYKVDVPGGDGDINVTQALTGNTVYKNREQEFVFTLMYPNWSFEKLKTEICNLIHGQEFDYELSWDPGYTYHGWFTVDKYETDGILNRITITVDANPYKSKGVRTEFIEMSGGRTVYLTSGRKPVRPKFEFSTDTIVTFEGNRYIMPPGAYTMNDVWFRQGTNEITFVETSGMSYITWEEQKRYTWREFKAKPLYMWYAGVQKYAVNNILLEGSTTPITGELAFTITGADGSTKTSYVDLGDQFIGKLVDYEYETTDEDGNPITATETFTDTLTIIKSRAYLYKVVGRNEDGTYEPLELPQSSSFPFKQLYFNDSEVVSLTCNGGSVVYDNENINIERTTEESSWGHYAQGGELAMEWEDIGKYAWNQVRTVVLETTNTTEKVVQEKPNYTVWVQYEWLDL